MSASVDVHGLSREVFDSLPGVAHEQSGCSSKTISLTDDFWLRVFTFEPPVDEYAVRDRADKQANDDRDDEREPAGEEA